MGSSSRARSIGLAAVVLFSGCRGAHPPEEGTYPPSSRRTSNASCFAIAPPPPPGRVTLERAFTHALDDGSMLRQGTHLVQSNADASEWLLALQDGRVLAFSSDPTERDVRVVLDLRGIVDRRYPENGLVSIALHPNFATNGYLFAVYRIALNPSSFGYSSRLARFTRDPSGAFDLASERVFLDIPQGSTTHAGNHVAFGLDGFLYYANGDDRATDVNAQNPNRLLGKVLRLDVDQEDSVRGTPYSIPPDNPFAMGGGAPEVYALGLRNPWRFTIDPENGAIYLGDVGQDRREEIDLVVPGGNYGWPLREGTLCFREEPCDDPAFIDPVVEVTHGEGRSIVAGYRYRRTDVPGLEGRYVFGDYISGNVFSISLDEPEPSTVLEIEGQFNLSSIAQGDDGTIYAVRYDARGDNGGVYRLVPTVPTASTFPDRLSETGCVLASDPRLPVPGVVPYRPIAALWSDGADKDRFFAIPDDRRIAIASDGDFDFPPGTVLIKHFRFAGRYHETRLLMRHDGDWYGYSYEWNDEQTDAFLLEAAVSRALPNGTRWQYPSRSACMQCHTDAAGRVLGLEVGQLAHAIEHAPGEPPAGQLEWLLGHDYFVPEIATIDEIRAGVAILPDPFGTAATNARARAYLHANCSMCHRPGGPGQGEIDLRFTATMAEMNACGQAPRVSRVWDLGNWDEQLLIAPGRPDDSTLYLRIALQGYFRMPPLATDVIDPDGTALVRAWIEGLTGCD